MDIEISNDGFIIRKYKNMNIVPDNDDLILLDENYYIVKDRMFYLDKNTVKIRVTNVSK